MPTDNTKKNNRGQGKKETAKPARGFGKGEKYIKDPADIEDLPSVREQEEAEHVIKKTKTRKKDPQTATGDKAHSQADKDISQDADLSIHSPNDDLDEGELANLGDDENDLV